ncbi:unnamed protein product [Ceutorhynchus assimilis]|uniref:RING-type E3 ubiquitin transferase n=1 Tax=Ceutorhynchus assimilis TaxID=467358 RepID=A0A9N9MAQ7_9CUCU|nr:unnamed protein product [Ceutorhynchus assimilis]
METENVYVPEEVAKNFKCVICQKFLFVPPIMTKDGTAFKCGRCSFIASDMTQPVHGFEKLASYMAFPCTFKGCTSKLPWEEVTAHEATCKYRIINCPCYHCDEKYPIYTIIQHFEVQHKKYMCMSQCNVQNRNIKQPYRCLMRLIIHEGKPYVMFNYRDDEYFWLSVYSIRTSNKNTNVELVFSSLDGKYSVTVKSESIQPFNEQEHCINCLDKDCKSKFHKFSKLYKSNGKIYDNMDLAVNINNVVKTLGSDSINYTVRIVEKMEVEPTVEPPQDSKKDLQLLVFLQNLECQICKSLMSAPIYNCITGHTMCKDCKARVMKCPQCQRELTDSRCFALEDIADKIKLDCTNKKLGCRFVGNIDENIAHEKLCTVVCNVIF